MAAITNHPSFLQPLDPSVPVWRYMDLSKFAALLQKKALTFSRADQLGDPFEGSVPLQNAQAAEKVLELRKLHPELDPYKQMPDDKVIEMHEQMRSTRKSFIRCSYVSCWHMNEFESAAMWKLYSKSSDAVCIKSTYKVLSDQLPIDTNIGMVKYIDFQRDVIDIGNLFNPLLVKRMSFGHEQEVRALAIEFSNMDKGNDCALFKDIPVDLAKLIKGVYVSPDAPDWFRDVVAALCQRYNLAIEVHHSELNALPLF